jgi:hypothetical protein
MTCLPVLLDSIVVGWQKLRPSQCSTKLKMSRPFCTGSNSTEILLVILFRILNDCFNCLNFFLVCNPWNSENSGEFSELLIYCG